MTVFGMIRGMYTSLSLFPSGTWNVSSSCADHCGCWDFWSHCQRYVRPTTCWHGPGARKTVQGNFTAGRQPHSMLQDCLTDVIYTRTAALKPGHMEEYKKAPAMCSKRPWNAVPLMLFIDYNLAFNTIILPKNYPQAHRPGFKLSSV